MNKLSSLVEYLSYLIKKYTEVQQMQMLNTFRIASIKNTENNPKIIFQVIGKSTFMECTPAEIIENPSFLERFSKQDIQKITYAHAQYENQKMSQTNNEIKLVKQEFSLDEGQTKFTLKDKKGNVCFKTAKEISLDKKLVSSLNKQDAINIGYIAGYEHSQQDPTE